MTRTKQSLMFRWKLKYLTVHFISAIYGFSGSAQNIPNASFDSIYVGGIDRVWEWVTSDAVYFNYDTVAPFTPNTYFPALSGQHHFAINTVLLNYLDPDTAHYINALVIYTRTQLKYPTGSQYMGFIMNGEHFWSDSQGYMDFSRGGTPFPFRPSHIQGLYKFEDSLAATTEYGQVKVLLRRWNPSTLKSDTIATAQSSTEMPSTSVWTPFVLPLVYADSAVPDTIVVVFQSSTFGQGPTTLWIDDISFRYGTIGIAPLKPANTYQLFPNPGSGLFSITPRLPEGSSYVLFDVQGRYSCEGSFEGNTLDLSNMPAGLYTIRIISAKGVHHQKVIKL